MKALLFSIDTEPDDPDWEGLESTNPLTPALGNISHLDKLLPCMLRTGLAHTLLATSSVVRSKVFATTVNTLSARGKLELGMHFHPADSPPYNPSKKNVTDNILQLDDDLLHSKLETLHWEMAHRFDAPVSFRGGAWSVDARVMHWLVQNKYQVDTSITSGIDWSLRQRPDWSDAPTHPYRINLNAPPLTDNQSPLIELPPNIWTSEVLPEWTRYVPGMRSLLTQPMKANQTLGVKMVRSLRPQEPRWLRPALESEAGLLKIAEAFADSPCLHVMIHSNELTAGASPYSRTPKAAAALLDRLEKLVETWVALGWVPMTLSEFAGVWSAENPPIAVAKPPGSAV